MKSRTSRLLPQALAALLFLGGCSQAEDREEAEREAEAEVNPLLFADRIQARGPAPATFRVRFETDAGEFVVEVRREWAPRGADRFHQLVRAGFFDDVRIYRAVDNFMAQFGLHGDPQVNYVWRDEILEDDPVRESNVRGRLAFAKNGPHSRTTEIFVSFKDNSYLDDMGFAPFAEVVQGMEAVDAIHTGYGDGPPSGTGPYGAMIQARGNAYLDETFPELTRILRALVID